MENNQTDLEEVIQEVEQENTVEETVEQDLSKFKSADDPEVIKVDLSKPPTNEVEENNTDDTGVAGSNEDAEPAQSEDEVQPEGEAQEETPVLEQVTDEDTVTKEKVMEALDESEATGKPLPENVQKLLNFIEETGGSLEDYVRLNRDVKDIDDQDALREYYQRTKPHLSLDEVDFLLEDKFSYDEDVDDAKDIKRKKLALKEQVAEAKAYLDGQKSKYYEEIKAGSNLTAEQQKAIDFFNRYNKESEQTRKIADKQKAEFTDQTNQVFNDKFKGFEYNVGEKVYRFNVNNVNEVKETQSDISNFVKRFLNKENTMSDAKGYHKSLFTAMNADAIAQHFYEQGKADAIKDGVAKAKNINTEARSSHTEPQFKNGIKARVLGDDSDSLRFKIKRKK
tara:strand:+ start:3460 stop:4644 length:1185 start_codon:yes stop_codon:yes gene_type:complete